MIKRRPLVFLLGIALLLVAACGVLSTGGPSVGPDVDLPSVLPPTVQVTGVFPNIQVRPDTVTAHRGETITWSHTFSGTVLIDLVNVPISVDTLVMEEGETGAAVINANAAFNTYKYDVTVTVGDSSVTLDPHVDIEPGGN